MVPGLNPVQSPPSVYHNSLKSKGRVRETSPHKRSIETEGKAKVVASV